MLKIFIVCLFAMAAYAGAAHARGGGAETMPSFSYTDLPPYHPQPACRAKRPCVYLWHHQQVHHH